MRAKVEVATVRAGIKDRLPPSRRTDVVYSILCAECDAVYVRETQRNMEVRIREHQRHTKSAQTERSAVAEHAHVCMKWDLAKVLASAGGWQERKVKEAIHIKKQARERELMNKDSGWHLSDNWQCVL